MALHRITLCLLFLSALTFPQAEARAAAADLELVLAVDVSGSIDARESALQREGYLAAIRSPEFAAAVRAGSLGKIRLAYVEWAGEAAQQVIVPWRMIDGPEAAQAFANELAGQPAARFRRGTSISSALRFSAGLFEGGGTRRVIDVSGDGPNNAGGMVTVARDAVVAQGIVINGLPMLAQSGANFAAARPLLRRLRDRRRRGLFVARHVRRKFGRSDPDESCCANCCQNERSRQKSRRQRSIHRLPRRQKERARRRSVSGALVPRAKRRGVRSTGRHRTRSILMPSLQADTFHSGEKYSLHQLRMHQIAL